MSIEELESKMTAAKAGQLKLAVFDNNQREVFDKGHIPTAKWVAFDKVQASDLPADKDTTLVFYCANEH
jgi:rhodanese-related sulfurtransferase